jgi:hypothetical protein
MLQWINYYWKGQSPFFALFGYAFYYALCVLYTLILAIRYNTARP